MHERVYAVQKGHGAQVSGQKPSLKIALLDGKQETQPRLVLDVQDEFAMVLSQLPQAIIRGEQDLSESLGDSIEQKIENPVEHLDQERPFGKDSGMPVVSKAGSIRRVNNHAAAISVFGWMLG